MKIHYRTSNQSIIAIFPLSLISSFAGFQIGAYGDIFLNIDTQLFGASAGAIIGGLVLGNMKYGKLKRALATGIAAGMPIWYLVFQNRAVAPIAIAVMVLTSVFYLLVISVISTVTTARSNRSGS